MKDNVNNPAHYKIGKTEAIDSIEDAVRGAPEPVFGYLQGNCIKYLSRMWYKDKPLEDAKKSEWYLKRLIKAIGKHNIKQ